MASAWDLLKQRQTHRKEGFPMKAWLQNGRFETCLALAIVIVTLVVFIRFQDDAELQAPPAVTSQPQVETGVETF